MAERVLYTYAQMGRQHGESRTVDVNGVISTHAPAGIGDMAKYGRSVRQLRFTREIAEATLNLERYPLDQLDSPAGEALVTHVRQQLEADSAFFLPGFLKEGATDVCAELFDYLHSQGKTHYSHSSHNVSRRDRVSTAASARGVCSPGGVCGCPLLLVASTPSIASSRFHVRLVTSRLTDLLLSHRPAPLPTRPSNQLARGAYERLHRGRLSS